MQEPVLATANSKNSEQVWEKCSWMDQEGRNYLAVGEACMAIFWPTLGFKRRTFELWVLNRWDFHFCIRSTQLRKQRPTDFPWLAMTSKLPMTRDDQQTFHDSQWPADFPWLAMTSRLPMTGNDQQTFHDPVCRMDEGLCSERQTWFRVATQRWPLQ